MNSKFPALKLVSTVLALIGWLSSIGGLIYVVMSLNERMVFQSQYIMDWFGVFTGVALIGGSLGLVVLAESVKVLAAIESNTNDASINLREIRKELNQVRQQK